MRGGWGMFDIDKISQACLPEDPIFQMMTAIDPYANVQNTPEGAQV